MRSSSVLLVEGDGERLPFSECSFDILITRLAEHSLQEAYRVLRKGGFFFEYRLGPEANKEIAEFFPARIEKESFFLPTNLEEWKKEVSKKVANVGFSVESIDDYKEKEYHSSEEELMNLIEMVPLVRNFDREKDKEVIGTLARKYRNKKGVRVTWHYYILMARRY
jgi:SAM-dependent methyltransferase